MLMSMRALPGRASRATLDATPAAVTRDNALADQRRRLLRAVGAIAAGRGYSEVTVELIAKRAHVSYKTFYKHFDSKQECFEALFQAAFEGTEKRIERALEGPDLTWADEIVIALRTFVEAIVAEPVMARAVIVESPTVGPAMTERYERATKALAPLLRAGRSQNPRGRELPGTIEDTLSGAVFWSAYERLIVDEAETLVEYLPVLTEMILRTYLGPEAATRIVRAEAPAIPPALA